MTALETNLPTEKAPQSLLGFLNDLIQAQKDDARSITDLLKGLAAAFGADAAGLAPLGDYPDLVFQAWPGKEVREPALRYPWKDDPQRLQQIHSTARAVEFRDIEASWLVTSGAGLDEGGWLLWLIGTPQRVWSSSEAAALPLVVQAMIRQTTLPAGPGWSRMLQRPHLQRRVEQAAFLTGRLAHDFGNFLTGILGFAELSMPLLSGDSPLRQYVHEILKSAQQGASWVNQLRLFSRRGTPAVAPIPLGPVVHQETARCQEEWSLRVPLLVSLADALPAVLIEPQALQQVLAALLANAREAIEGTGAVTLSARAIDLTADNCLDYLGKVKPGRYVEIAITDTGKGLTPETRSRLFQDLFFSTKMRHRGLGLAVVYGLLQSYGGGLRFGPDPARGTAVHVVVPAAAAKGSGQTTEAAAPPQGTGRILVVDDDPLVLSLISSVLEKAGHCVNTAPGPREGLACFTGAAEPYDLVLSDILMPEMNGFDLVRKLGEHQADVNVLFISSMESLHSKAEMEMLQKYGLLRKPFFTDQLLAAVAGALARRKSAGAKKS